MMIWLQSLTLPSHLLMILLKKLISFSMMSFESTLHMMRVLRHPPEGMPLDSSDMTLEKYTN